MALVKTVMVQIGQTALRAPDGSFLPSVPLYVREEDVEKLNSGRVRPVLKDTTDAEFIKTFSNLFERLRELEERKAQKE